MAIAQPNYTQMPNFILDNLGDFTESELKVILFVCRKSIGFHKATTGKISITGLCAGTKLSRQSTLKAIAGLIEKDLVEKNEVENSYSYSLKVEPAASPNFRLVKNLDQLEEIGQKFRPVESENGLKSEPKTVKNLDTLKEIDKERRSKETSFFKESDRTNLQTIEPEQPETPASLSSNAETPIASSNSREDGSSAAPEISKNWRSHYERFHRPPWRLEDGSFHPLIIKALHETGGSPGKPNIHDRPDGRMNEAKLAKMLRRLDTSALGSGYRAACSSTQELSDYWNRAVEMHEEQQAASERVATVPVPHIDLIAPPTEEEKRISSEGAAIARRLMMGGKA